VLGVCSTAGPAHIPPRQKACSANRTGTPALLSDPTLSIRDLAKSLQKIASGKVRDHSKRKIILKDIIKRN